MADDVRTSLFLKKKNCKRCKVHWQQKRTEKTRIHVTRHQHRECCLQDTRKAEESRQFEMQCRCAYTHSCIVKADPPQNKAQFAFSCIEWHYEEAAKQIYLKVTRSEWSVTDN